MKKILVPAVAAAALFGAGAAQAGKVYWSLGISVPVVAAVVSSAPGGYYGPAPVAYAPAPVYYAPAPAYYEPAPAYYVTQPVVYARPRVVYARPEVVYAPSYYRGGRPVPVVYQAYGHRQGWTPPRKHPHRYHDDD